MWEEATENPHKRANCAQEEQRIKPGSSCLKLHQTYGGYFHEHIQPQRNTVLDMSRLLYGPIKCMSTLAQEWSHYYRKHMKALPATFSLMINLTVLFTANQLQYLLVHIMSLISQSPQDFLFGLVCKTHQFQITNFIHLCPESSPLNCTGRTENSNPFSLRFFLSLLLKKGQCYWAKLMYSLILILHPLLKEAILFITAI